MTSNNKGVDAGVGTLSFPNLGVGGPTITVFSPDPHTVTDPYTKQTIQSPGYVGSESIGGPVFNGSIGGINDNRTIVGNTDFRTKVPFLLAGRLDSVQGVPDLGNLGGKNGVANALNNSDQVVGWSEIADGTHHAFLYANGTMQDLNLLAQSLPGAVLNDAVGIDGAGRIVAFGSDGSDATHEYLLTPDSGNAAPVPEPQSAMVFLAMLAGLGLYRWPCPL